MKILIAAIELEIMKNSVDTFEKLKIHSLFTFKGITPVLKFENVETRSKFLNTLKKYHPVSYTYIVDTPDVVTRMDTLALDPNATYVAGYTKHTDVLVSKPPFKKGGIIDLALVTDILYVSYQEDEVYSLTELLSSIQSKNETT